MMNMNNVKNLEMMLIELNDSVKNLVTNGIEATELHILLSELDKTLTRGKECIVRENCCYAEAFRNIANLDREKEHNDELQEMTEFDQFIKNCFDEKKSVHKSYKYILEFEDRIGYYTLHYKVSDEFTGIVTIDLYGPNRIYKNTRVVKALVEDQDSYIESYNIDEGYLIIRNDTMNKFAIFTSKDGCFFYYLEPEDICKDADRI